MGPTVQASPRGALLRWAALVAYGVSGTSKDYKTNEEYILVAATWWEEEAGKVGDDKDRVTRGAVDGSVQPGWCYDRGLVSSSRLVEDEVFCSSPMVHTGE